MAALFLLLFLSLAEPVLSARIAGFWTAGGSQYINMRQIMEELASRQHEVRNGNDVYFVHSDHGHARIGSGFIEFIFFALCFKQSLF